MKTPLMVFDGDCGFCRAWIGRWREITGDRVAYEPYQKVARDLPHIPESAFAEAVHLVEPDGRVSRGAEAVFRSLAIGGRRWPLRLYDASKPVRRATEAAYAFVARNRGLFSKLTAWLYGGDPRRSTYARTTHIGLRALGVVYLVAFASYWAQAPGLIGASGIAPAAAWLDAIRPRVAELGWWNVPTLLWLQPSDAFLHALFAAGVGFSLALALGVAPLLSAVALWALYLSLCVVGGPFLSFQWDALLLETGFLAILLAPWTARLRWGRDPAPPRLAVFLMHWLAFRLMFSSGYVKRASGDPSWSDLTALTYHYWTQPLPTWTAWYADRLPLWIDKASCAAMFAIELAAPFLIWMPRRLRHTAAWSFIALMLVIAATGNYAYFNLLTVVLALWLFDDRALRGARADAPARPGRARRWAIAPAGAVVLLLSTVIFTGTLRWEIEWPRWVGALYDRVAPFRSVNGYGLFAVMTKTRPEIVIEGSTDGHEWRAYEFRWKPGAVDRRPRFVAPHQPRLDWQMWFAALGEIRGNPWLVATMRRLLEGERDVLALLAGNPFPGAPPRWVRAVGYEYRFASPGERRAGAWWTREAKGLYCPPIRFDEAGNLVTGP